MSIIKYLNHRQKFLHRFTLAITLAQISSEVQVKVFSDETSLNGEIYASPTVPPPESPLPVPLPPLPPLGIGMVIGRIPPSSDAAAEAATVALVAAEAPDPQGKVALRIGRYMSKAGIEVLYYGSAADA